MDNLPLPIEPSHPIYLALTEIQKPRSRFQLEKFVLGQHDTVEQQYKQCLVEIQELIYNLKIVSLKLKKQQVEIDRLKASEDEIDLIDSEIKEIEMHQTKLVMLGAQRELQDLVGIWESFEHKYSYEELESSQLEYWDKRLKRQSILENIGGSQAQASHLEALRQIGIIEMAPNGIKEVELEDRKEIS
jgi:hypothetical protein